VIETTISPVTIGTGDIINVDYTFLGGGVVQVTDLGGPSNELVALGGIGTFSSSSISASGSSTLQNSSGAIATSTFPHSAAGPSIPLGFGFVNLTASTMLFGGLLANATIISSVTGTLTSIELTLDANQLAIIQPAAVPVPAALPLFASGLLGLGILGWRRRRKAVGLAGATLAAVFCLATPSGAAPITYNVDLIVGPGTITGFIETNGDIGVLSTGDITDWSLTLFDGAASVTIQPGAVGVSGSSLTATSTGLFFDFSGLSGAFFGFPTDPYLCFEDATGACSFHPSTISMNIPGGIGPFWVSYSGNVEIASAVPIPAALPLFVTGLAGMGLLGRRRK
jgi:hypothetical protein